MPPGKIYTFHRRKILLVFLICALLLLGLAVRLGFLMLEKSEYYSKKAEDLHERERPIKAARGRILDVNGTVLADNKTVCTISVIHSQIEDGEEVIQMLCRELELSEASVRKKVEKNSSMERIKSNVEKEIGDKIRNYGLPGVKVDEDYKRYYPYSTLASKVLGFTGGDNQGIIGLEVEYDSILEGTAGKILTMTDARGIELPEAGESRQEPIAGQDLVISLDYNIQKYVEQEALRVREQKQADSVSIILLNPQNGEIYAMTNVPEFDLNNPFALLEETQSRLQKEGEADEAQETESDSGSTPAKTAEELEQEALNQMWRNGCINDTYEPGSTFKVITASAGLEEGVVSLEDHFSCPGFKIVEDRRIRCHKTTGHGAETFLEAAQNSCNPVFIEVGLRLGVERFFHYLKQFGVLDKTGIDLPGEAATIMHKQENVGQVELATISFGQSFQITPIQLASTVASLVNGGKRITPHFGVETRTKTGTLTQVFQYPLGEQIVSEKTSETMQYILEHVVSDGSGKRGYIAGYHVGGKTATSETLPRSANIYISSFVGFAPADNPQVLGLCIINHPQGIYYGGTIAAPVIQRIFTNILPYLGIEQDTSELPTEKD
ncbi:MAG: penicillin-binding transpeptidase domain-containing protein [Lachnospiraceae bacterium]|nr:penicillin-binding transpeptidase domain-containing protein [Lachnospiraceae bacterium]